MKRQINRYWFVSALFLGTLFAMPTLALSCASFGVAEAFNYADASPDRHVIVIGKLTFDEELLPETDWNNQAATPALTRIPAKMTGHSLGKNGFVQRYSTALSLDVRCLGPWCAGAKSGATYMALINIDHTPAIVQTAPCGSGLIANPTDAHKRDVQICLNNGKCTRARVGSNK